jgi:hypothetical protein
MNLLFHEKIKKEQYKDRLAEAAHWRLVKELKKEQKKEEQPGLVSTLLQVLESGRDCPSEVALLRQSSKEEIA